jgi:hypothetical protein
MSRIAEAEVTVIAHHLQHQGVLATIEERVCFARRRFGHYDLIDFVVVLLAYAASSERTLEEFYESIYPFAAPFPIRKDLASFDVSLVRRISQARRS